MILFNKLFNIFFYIILLNFVQIILSPLPHLKHFNWVRGFFLKPFFKGSKKNLQIAKNVTFVGAQNITVGDNVYIANNCWINGIGGLKIEDNVIVSPNVVIATTQHSYIDGIISNKKGTLGPINIGKGSWICSNSTITKNVNIGKGVIVAANSSVIKDINDYILVGGVPAVERKKLIKEKNK